MGKSTILLIAVILITLLIGGAIYILLDETFARMFQKTRFSSTLTQRKTVEDPDAGLAGAIRKAIEFFQLEKFFKVDQIKTTLANTGSSTSLTLDSVLLAKVSMPILVGFVAFNFNISDYIVGEKHPHYQLIAILSSAALGMATFPIPNILIEIDAKKRASDFMMTFPSVIDLLLICIQSGISFEHSLQRVTRDASMLSPVTGEELARIMRDIHLLGNRERALMNFKRRIPTDAVDDFVLVILQSERYGTSMSDALRVLSDTVRTNQMNAVERMVMKLPPKISALVMLFMMPAVLGLIFAPILLGGFG